MSDFNYYREQLNKLDFTGDYLPTIVINDGQGNNTKHLSLTNDCIDELVKFLFDLKTYNLDTKRGINE